ncbi:four helix bundle protein [candidate division KSB1 bacterium]|nr:four helix bundle protein [candidate division KSB1 bacterium]
MPVFKKFEDIQAWQDARVLANSIYAITQEESFSRDFGLRDQLRRAAISVLSNIAEGFERETTQEFIRFLYIAKASAGEIRAQLYIATDLRYLTNEEAKQMIDICIKISSMIANLIKYLKNK